VGRHACITTRIIRSVWHRNGKEKSECEDINMVRVGKVWFDMYICLYKACT
jgi:hypothetical protein